jgi:predicted dehydrogenase
MKAHLKWGIVATGGIATDFAQALSASSRCSVVDVAGTSAAKAAAFAQRWSLPRSSSSLSDMLSNPEVEAVYIASPHPSHAEQAIQCLEAGKAVLCEKPLTLTAQSAERVIAVAKERKVPLIEAFMYRCHPLTRALIERLRAGAIGRVLKVKADFCFRVERSPEHRLFNPQLGGGGILDVGGYPASFARLVAGVANGGELEEPISVQGRGTLGPTGVDESASATLKFASGVEAELRCAVHEALGTETVITGERGKIVLADPWIPRGQRQGLDSEFTIYAEGKAPEVVAVHTTLATYAIEAETIADTLPDLEARWPAMSWADTLGNMRVLDAWLRDVHKAV